MAVVTNFPVRPVAPAPQHWLRMVGPELRGTFHCAAMPPQHRSSTSQLGSTCQPASRWRHTQHIVEYNCAHVAQCAHATQAYTSRRSLNPNPNPSPDPITPTQAYIKEQKWLDEVFDEYDTDKSGELEKGELIELLRRVSRGDRRANPNPNPTPTPIHRGSRWPFRNPAPAHGP